MFNAALDLGFLLALALRHLVRNLQSREGGDFHLSAGQTVLSIPLGHCQAIRQTLESLGLNRLLGSVIGLPFGLNNFVCRLCRSGRPP